MCSRIVNLYIRNGETKNNWLGIILSILENKPTHQIIKLRIKSAGLFFKSPTYHIDNVLAIIKIILFEEPISIFINKIIFLFN